MSNVQELYRNILEAAGQQIDPGLPTRAREAVQIQKALEIAAYNRASLFTVMVALTTNAAARINDAGERLYQAHPDKFQDLRGFLQSVDLPQSTISILVGLAETIVPFCDEHKIDEINDALQPTQLHKLREAIAALRRACQAQDPNRVREILDYVLRARTRDIVRRKYRRSRSPVGHGVTVDTDRGLVVVAVVPNGSGDEIAGKLHGTLELNNGNPPSQYLGVMGAAMQALAEKI